MKYLSIFIRVALLALGQSLDCHSASEVSLMDMGKSVNVKPQQSTAKQKPCAHFMGYTVDRRALQRHGPQAVETQTTQDYFTKTIRVTLRDFQPSRLRSRGCVSQISWHVLTLVLFKQNITNGLRSTRGIPHWNPLPVKASAILCGPYPEIQATDD